MLITRNTVLSFCTFNTTNMKLIVKYSWAFVFLLCSFSGLQAQDELSRANSKFELQAYNDAITVYKTVLAKDPNNITALSKIADAYRRTNQMKEAALWYEKAVKTGRAQPEVILEYGLTLKGLNKYSEAKRSFNSYATSNPKVGIHLSESCDFAVKQNRNPASYKVFRELMNSAQADYSPAFYGKSELVYASARTDIKNAAVLNSISYPGESNSQLFKSNISRRGSLGKPKLLLEGIQAKTKVGPVTFSKDKQSVFYTENNFGEGNRWFSNKSLVLRLYAADIDNNQNWTGTKPLPFNGDNHSVGFPVLTADGKTLLFASDMAGGFGGFDLYVSYRQGNSWSKPINLGPKVNTEGDEITPFIIGSMLYFSSNWHWGLGGFDIFSAKQSNGTWSEITHLGKEINSTRDDVGFVFDIKKATGYFASNRLGGKGDFDIYRATPTAQAPKPITDIQKPSKPNYNGGSGNSKPTQPQTKPSNNNDDPGRDQIITIKILSSENDSPLSNAILDFANCGEGTFPTNFEGVYQFKALAGLNCNVIVRKEGYGEKMINVRTTLDEFRTLELSLDPLEAGFPGFVLDETSQNPIQNVYVKARDLATNQEIQGVSNANGRYVLDLQKNGTYRITFSKSGYEVAEISATTLDGSNKNLLGKTRLKRSSTYAKPGTKPSTKPTIKPSARGIVEAWAIQIGVFRNPDIRTLQQLKEFGNVFREPIKDGLMRYKIGTYKSRAEAAEIKRKIIAKTGMYKDAIFSKIVDTDVIDETYISPNIPGGANRPGAGSKPQPQGIVYKIQLGVYSNPRFFDRQKYADLGSISTTQKVLANGKNVTVFLLGNFASQADAEKVKKTVIARGLPKVFVVPYKNGQPFKK